jgi:hypothetical protein
MRFRRLYRCSFANGKVTRLTAALDDDYADCSAHLYEVVATGIEHPQVNTVIRSSKRNGHTLLAAHFEPREIRVVLHHEAVIGRLLADAQADELLDWSGVAAETDEAGIIVGVTRTSGTAH